MQGIVNNFRFMFNQDKVLWPNLLIDPTLELFRGVKADDYREYMRSDSAGIMWLFGQEKLRLYEPGIRIFGLPTHDNRFIVAIYPLNGEKFRAPQNAVLYNANGTLKKCLKPPELLSNLAKSRKKFINSEYSMSLYFDTVGIKRDHLGNKLTYLRISFDRDFWEDHKLDVETGEFAGMIDSGMR